MFSLTKEEQQVILFLFFLSMFGAGVSFSVKLLRLPKTASLLEVSFAKFNLNTITEEDISVLPGIGERIAKRIVEYRINNVSFSNIEELRGIKGISQERFERIKDYFYIN